MFGKKKKEEKPKIRPMTPEERALMQRMRKQVIIPRRIINLPGVDETHQSLRIAGGTFRTNRNIS